MARRAACKRGCRLFACVPRSLPPTLLIDTTPQHAARSFGSAAIAYLLVVVYILFDIKKRKSSQLILKLNEKPHVGDRPTCGFIDSEAILFMCFNRFVYGVEVLSHDIKLFTVGKIKEYVLLPKLLDKLYGFDLVEGNYAELLREVQRLAACHNKIVGGDGSIYADV